MPRSQRTRPVTLSKTKPKTKEAKNNLITEVQKALRQFRYAYVVEIANERNNILKKIRDEVKPGRLFLGKNKAIQLALGVDEASAELPNSHRLSAFVSGHRGLLCTDLSTSEMSALLERHDQSEYARTGCIATGAVSLEEGADALSTFPHSIEPHLRSLGLPTSLQNGKIVLMGDYKVCEEGERLGKEQCEILKLLGVPLTMFRARAVVGWEKSGIFSKIE